ncbi:Ig-like domain-containing protein, partial [Endozoicomonas montiporae]
MAPAYTPENAPVLFVGVQGDVTVKDASGKEIKLNKGDQLPTGATIVVGKNGKIVFKQADKILKYDGQGEASLNEAITQSSDASSDTEIKDLVDAAEQMTAPTTTTTVQQPLAKPVARPDTSSPTPAKQGITEPPVSVEVEQNQKAPPTATEIVAEMANRIVSNSNTIAAAFNDSETQPASFAAGTPGDSNRPPATPDVPPSAPAIKSFEPNTGSSDDHLTSVQQLTIIGSAPSGTQVTLYCDGIAVKRGVPVTSQGLWSTSWNTGKDGSFKLTATATSGTASSEPSPAFTVQVDSTPPVLEFDDPATSDNYNFVTYTKSATITGTAAPGLKFTLKQGDNSWEVSADDKGVWSHQVTGLSDGIAEFTASAASIAGAEVHKTAGLLVQSTPYDFQIHPDYGSSSTDAITNSENLSLSVKSQPGSTVIVTILGTGKQLTVNINEDGIAETTPFQLTDNRAYDIQLKTIYTSGEGESDTIQKTVTLDTIPPVITMDPHEAVYKNAEISLSGTCNEEGSTVSIKLVNIFHQDLTDSTTAKVENGVFSATVTAPEQGHYRAEVSVVDTAGNKEELLDDLYLDFMPPMPELIVQTQPKDSSTNTNPEWSGSFPHEGKLIVTFNGQQYDITVENDNTWSFKFGAPFDFGRHTVTFNGTQTGLPGKAIFEDSFSVIALHQMELSIDQAPDSRTNESLLVWKGSGAAKGAKVTLTLTPAKGNSIKEIVDADNQGSFEFTVNAPEGSYTTAITATASDYEHSSITGLPVTVDHTGPKLTDIEFKPDVDQYLLTGKAIDQFGNPEASGSVAVSLNSRQSYLGSIKNGQFSVELLNLKPDQDYKATITATDDLGNVETEVSQDFTVPALPSMTLVLDEATSSAGRIGNTPAEWKGSGAAPNA